MDITFSVQDDLFREQVRAWLEDNRPATPHPPMDDLPACRDYDLAWQRHLYYSGWAATYLCSPFAVYITGHTLVIDGANWLRRGLRMPEFTPVRDTIVQRRGS
jgi:hypothetical protein